MVERSTDLGISAETEEGRRKKPAITDSNLNGLHSSLQAVSACYHSSVLHKFVECIEKCNFESRWNWK